VGRVESSIFHELYDGLVNGIPELGYRAIVLKELQSSINENMPFHCLSRIASLFENTVTDKAAVYRQSLVKLSRPVFIVLYTSREAYPDRTTLKLSDAFEKVEVNDRVNLELTVDVININKGRNTAIIVRSEKGGVYSLLTILRPPTTTRPRNRPMQYVC
jgi:hypothetical protein